ncbi:methyltransferase domain-containing protein [Actinopolymorpha sp. B9G3]|uniref:TRM11 family SAM-dependent methyltransferase n=1 Tax=Actinopolymorpha sp. B9G3 TaxID=3158970 RepID=UPI0032D96A15
MAHRPAPPANRAERAGRVSRRTADSTRRMFVLAVPGLAPLVRRELAGLTGVRVTDVGNDGRSDVLLCEVAPGAERRLLRLASVEDVFAEFGRTLRSEGDRPPWIARRLLHTSRLDNGVQLWRSQGEARSTRGKGQRGPLTYRVVVRVLEERTWQRTQLRRALSDAVAAAEPRWRTADPAQVELWTVEYTRGRFVAGVRLTTAQLRQHGGRATERTGALRPTVAAAMVGLAGTPPETAGQGTLLDPCCGSGTILAEAKAAGWSVQGRDIDPSAASATRRNVRDDRDGRAVVVADGDARELDLDDAAVDGCVSNLPFGRQYTVQGEPRAWLRDVLTEMARVTRAGGRIVLLAPDIPKASVPSALRFRDRYDLRLLGARTAIWVYDRR